jgi:hypothetical protein
MLVYTLLFTLVGVEPSKNRYVDMFFIWLSYLIRNSGLGADDKVAILIDAPTLEYLNTFEQLSFLLDSSDINIFFYTITQPKTITDGILERYRKENGIFCDTLSMFLDLDMMITRPFKHLFLDTYEPDTLIVNAEGRLTDGCYAGDLVSLPPELVDYCGFSAAFFVFTNGPTILTFFASIQNDCRERIENPMYTVDQPFYNKYVYECLQNKLMPINIRIINNKYIENNQYHHNNECFIINFAGIPGNDSFHFNKMFTLLCYDFIKEGQPAPPEGERLMLYN